jgi:UPF0716 family protein affecting phage T7 exclusion
MKKRKRIEKSKKGFMLPQLGWAVYAIIILAILIFGVWFLQKQGINILNTIKEIFRFGR